MWPSHLDILDIHERPPRYVLLPLPGSEAEAAAPRAPPGPGLRLGGVRQAGVEPVLRPGSQRAKVCPGGTCRPQLGQTWKLNHFEKASQILIFTLALLAGLYQSNQ